MEVTQVMARRGMARFISAPSHPRSRGGFSVITFVPRYLNVFMLNVYMGKNWRLSSDQLIGTGADHGTRCGALAILVKAQKYASGKLETGV